MACGQCSTGACGNILVVKDAEKKPGGCQSGSCSSGGCSKMNSFDWLGNMNFKPKEAKFNIVEVKFKGGRKEFFKNTNKLELFTGDFVVCDMPSGYHIGAVSMQGDLVRVQMAKRGAKTTDEIPKILRIATEKDLEKHTIAINRDLVAMYRTRIICKELKLNLKLSEVEFQSDNSKATFYYSAEDRVDFRELIKLLASEFKVRIEMRQISLRQEAGRIGGIGSCGRELCCTTWLSDFKAIPTAAARYQNLSLNPAKLSGQCGRLKCCLNYELETYIDAIRGIPTVDRPLQTEKGDATIQKTDIFRKIMWFSYPNETNWYPIACSQVAEIQSMNKEGKKPVGLENLMEIGDMPQTKATINNDLERLDKKYHTKKRGNKPKPNGPSVSGETQSRTPQSNFQNKPKQNNPPQKTEASVALVSGTENAKSVNANEPNRNKNKNKFRNKNRNQNNRPQKDS